jgi:hypothetical protein
LPASEGGSREIAHVLRVEHCTAVSVHAH